MSVTGIISASSEAPKTIRFINKGAATSMFKRRKRINRKEQARMKPTSALANRLGSSKTMIQIQPARKHTGNKPQVIQNHVFLYPKNCLKTMMQMRSNEHIQLSTFGIRQKSILTPLLEGCVNCSPPVQQKKDSCCHKQKHALLHAVKTSNG